jgi:S-adenosylmethionine:tRNA ribosyltransferase-isomerase
VLTLESGLEVTVVRKEPDGMLQMAVPPEVDMEGWLDRYGQVPLPPYLGREAEPADRERYQTVFAREAGAVAAPTAGLHFTQRTFEALRLRGVTVAELVLHVGPGTFRPIKTHLVREHRLDPERYFIPEETWSLVDPNRNSSGRTLAVGTTVVRALESAAMGPVATSAPEGWSDLLIAPPFEFRVVDALLTNFHLPSSSLLALVAAFAGLELTLASYRAAVEARYRFYSYGDAMLIL